MNNKQLISYITPAQFRDMPDQTVKILNEIISEINELRRNK